MLEHSLATFERKIQSRKFGVAFFELIDDAKRLQIVLESAELSHAIVQRVLTRMSERRVAKIVREADRLGQRLVQAQRACDGPADLGNLERMGDPGAVQVAFVVHENLRLVDEPAKGIRVNDP